MLTNTKIASALVVTAAATFATASTAQAGLSSTPWDNPNGSAATYDYSDGSSSTGLYNDPIVSGDALLFTPDTFLAQASGGTDSTSETLCVTLTADDGLMFTGLNFAMGGDFAVLGQSLATAGAVMTVENLDTNVILSSDPEADVFVGGDGLFDFEGDVALPDGWTNVLVKITGDLFAEGGEQGSASIQFKSVGLDAQTAVVPIPAAAFAAPLLMLGGLKARKRFSKKR